MTTTGNESMQRRIENWHKTPTGNESMPRECDNDHRILTGVEILRKRIENAHPVNGLHVSHKPNRAICSPTGFP